PRPRSQRCRGRGSCSRLIFAYVDRRSWGRSDARRQGGSIVDFIDEITEKGVTERRFDLKIENEVVPGILWSPDGATTPGPLVLIGHGGSQHKRVPNVLALARRLVRHLGYAAVAIDAPDHGDRAPRDQPTVSLEE